MNNLVVNLLTYSIVWETRYVDQAERKQYKILEIKQIFSYIYLHIIISLFILAVEEDRESKSTLATIRDLAAKEGP